MKRILLTGATGFVGKQVLKRLSNQNVSIRIISRNTQEKNFSAYKNISEVIETKNFFTESSEWYEESYKILNKDYKDPIKELKKDDKNFILKKFKSIFN